MHLDQWETHRSVADPMLKQLWHSCRDSSCGSHDDQEQHGRVKKEATRGHLMLKAAANQKHSLGAEGFLALLTSLDSFAKLN